MKNNRKLCYILVSLAIGYLMCAYILNIKMNTTYVFDYFFSSDCPRVLEDLQNAFGWHDRIKVHPLFLMMVQPFFQMIKGVFSTNENGRVVLQALVAVLNCYGIYSIVYKISNSVYNAILSMLIYALSFSTIIFTAVTETFLYATFCFILFWNYIVYLENCKEINWKNYVILIVLGILCFSITITNIIPYVIGVIYLGVKRNGIKKSFKFIIYILGCVAVSCIILSVLQKIAFPNVTAFFDIILRRVENEEVKYMDFSLSFSRVISSLKIFFFGSFVAPKMNITLGGIEMMEYEILPKILLIIIMVAMFALIITAMIKRKIQFNKILIPMITSVLFNFLLHLVYGVGYVFLYSAHWVFLLAIISGILYSGLEDAKYKKIYVFLCIAFAFLELICNINKFIYIVNRVQYRFGFFEFTKWDVVVFVITIILLCIITIGIEAIKRNKKNWINVTFIVCFTLISCYSAGVVITRIESGNTMKTESSDNVTYNLEQFNKQIIYFDNNIFVGNKAVLLYEGFTGNIIQKGNVLYCNGDENMPESFKIIAKKNCIYKEDINGQSVLFDGNISRLPTEYYFGMGLRNKFILYKKNTGLYELKDYYTDEVILKNIEINSIDTLYYIAKGKCGSDNIQIKENENGIYLYRNNKKIILDESMKINIPDFSKYKYEDKLRILFYEVMINMTENGPKPNFIVYKNSFYRDAALAAMVCNKTGNMQVLTKWIEGMNSVYDHARVSVNEPDNLGQVLFLQSLVKNKNKKLINDVIIEAERITDSRGVLNGITDGDNHPIYATGWLKFGLESLGMDSSKWKLPLDVEDSYADLLWFYNSEWMKKYKQSHQYHCDTAWQYLDYARAHFFNYPIEKRDKKNNEFPLSYEVGSNADYFKYFDEDIYKLHLATPHIWGAQKCIYIILNYNV